MDLTMDHPSSHKSFLEINSRLYKKIILIQIYKCKVTFNDNNCVHVKNKTKKQKTHHGEIKAKRKQEDKSKAFTESCRMNDYPYKTNHK